MNSDASEFNNQLVSPSSPQPTTTTLVEQPAPFDPYDKNAPQPTQNASMGGAPTSPLDQYQVAPKKKSFKGLIILAIVGLLIAVLGIFGTVGMLAAYDKVNLPTSLNPVDDLFTKIVSDVPFLPKTPKLILLKSAFQHKSVSTAYIEASSAVDSNELSQLFMNKPIEFLVKGPMDVSDPENPKTALNINLSNEFITDVVVKDNNLYFQITKIPTFLFLAMGMMGIDDSASNPMLNRWIHSSLEPLETEASQALEGSEPKADEFMETRIEEFANDKLLPKMKLTTEKDGNEDVFKIVMDLQSGEVNEFLKIIGSNDSKTDMAVYEDAFKIENINATMTFGKSDYLMRKAVMVMTFKSKVPEAYSNVLGRNTNIMDDVESSEGETVKVSAAVVFSRYGEAFEITAPENPTELEDWFLEVGNYLSNSMRQSQPDPMYQDDEFDAMDGFSDDTAGFE